MVKPSPEIAGLVAGASLAIGLLWARSAPPPLVAAAAAAAPRAVALGLGEIPSIGLARLEEVKRPQPAGRRDVFAYGAARLDRRSAAGSAPPPVTMAPPPTLPVVTEPTPPPVPPLSVKFIGAVENKQGLKVAVLLTDRKEILTGKVGEVVGNRLRIVKIGLESVDVQDVGGGAVRRLPLRGN
jgi:hypothetical protein